MTENENTQAGAAPSEPEKDPTQAPAPPANPDVDQEAVEKSEEQIEKVLGD